MDLINIYFFLIRLAHIHKFPYYQCRSIRIFQIYSGSIDLYFIPDLGYIFFALYHASGFFLVYLFIASLAFDVRCCTSPYARLQKVLEN